MASSERSSAQELEMLQAILGAHPRLGHNVTGDQSAVEQAHLNNGAENEKADLRTLNQAYEDTFPGLRYIVFVNSRPRSDIMYDMRARIQRGDIHLERQEAIKVRGLLVTMVS
ncbi:MAG: hypothetical protein M1817_005699 [Caeruleum heppii]|nr:MAG: hypothetical protein M1817_005699 [Caeruleum heppii]